MSEQDVPRILNCLPSKEIENDWFIEDAAAAGVGEPEETLPESIDLREDWWKIGNQGSTGSCVGWAAAHAVLQYAFVKARKISTNEELSVRYVGWHQKRRIGLLDIRQPSLRMLEPV